MSLVVTRWDAPPKRELPITVILPPVSLIKYRARSEPGFVHVSRRSRRELRDSVRPYRSSTGSHGALFRLMVNSDASPIATDPPRRPGASSRLACCEFSFGSTSGSGDPTGRTTKGVAADRPPRSGGFTTLTRLVAGAAVSAAERNAINCVSLTNDVDLFCPFH